MADYVLSAKGTYDGSNFDSGIDRSQSKLDEFMGKAKSVGSRIASALGSGVTKAVDGIASTIGTVGAAVGGLAAQGGISRALNIEQAQYKLKQMGLDVESVMASCNEAVTGTAHGLDAAATVAASLGASGVQAGEQMTNALKAVAGMATMSGRSMEDVGLIMGKVAATGKLQGDELNQLAESGINATAELAKYLGKTQAEVREMVSAGEIDFQTFSDAMYASFGTAAQGANETFSGAMSNVRAALSRVGEMFASPALDGLRQVFAAAIPVIDSVKTALAPVADEFSGFIDSVVPKVVDGLGQLKEMIEGLGDGGFTNLSTGAKVAAAALGVLSVGSLGGLISQVPIVGDALGGLFGTLGSLASPATLLQGAFQKATTAMDGFKLAVANAGGGLTGLKTVAAGVLSPFNIMLVVLAALAAAFVYLFATNEQFRNEMVQVGSQLASTLLPVLQQLASAILPAIGSLISALLPLMQTIIEVIAQILVAIAPVVAMVASTVIPIIAQVITLAAQVVAQIVEMVIPIIQQLADFIAANMPFIQQVITTVLTVVMQLFQTVWPAIQAIVQAAMQVIQSVIEVAWPIIQSVIEAAMGAIKAIAEVVWPAIQSLIETVMGVIQGVVEAIMAVIEGDWEGAWNAIKGVADTIWNALSGIVSAGVNAIGGFVSGLVSRVTGFFSNLWSSVTSTVSSLWSSVTSAFSSGVSSAVSFVSSLPGKIMNLFSNAGSWLINSGRSIIDGLVNGIKCAIGGAINAVSGAISSIRNLFPFSPAKEGPFSGRGWVKYSGISIMEALAEGAESQVGKTVRAYSGMADKVRAAMDVSPNVADMSVQTSAVLRGDAILDYGQSGMTKNSYETNDNRAKYVTFNVSAGGGNVDAQEIAKELYTLFKRDDRGWAH